MDVVHERCRGLEVQKKTVVACLIVPGPTGIPRKEVRTFSTMTEDLLALGDWLAEAQVSHVAMESTASYWKPVYNLLEDRFILLLANAQHVKQVPGRKTDVRDAEWLADLLRHGLLRSSFVPDRPQREVRELTRYRTILVLVYHLLKRVTTYADLGGSYFDERERETVQRRLVRRLGSLGYRVTLDPLVAPTPPLSSASAA